MTKGIIISKILNTNKYKVRLPIFETAGNTQFYMVEANLSYNPGTIDAYKAGDVVYVAFENNEIDNPVIIGKLYTQENKAEGSSNLESLKTSKTASLPRDTTINEVNVMDRIEELINKCNNLEKRVEELESK